MYVPLLALLACGEDPAPRDADHDGSPAAEDCDDADATVYLGAPEYCRDGRVNDCALTEEEARDFCSLWRDVSAESASATLDGEKRGDRAGATLVGAGDVTGDGVGDLVVGAPGHGSGGGVYVVSGGVYERDDLGTADALLTADEGDAGSALAAADLDGDGVADLVVGAPGADAVYAASGPFDGEGELDRPISGPDGSSAGSALGIGDLDGDGAADVVIGAPEADVDDVGGAGAVYVTSDTGRHTLGDDERVVSGAASGDDVGGAVAVGDLDGDGVDDLAVGASAWEVDGAVAVLYGPLVASAFDDADAVLDGPYESLAGTSLAAGQDTDGDGKEDLVIGAPNTDDAGAAFVVTNVRTGALEVVASASLSAVRAKDEAGTSVALLGDVDADGFADIGVGAPEWGYASGAAYVVYGPVRGGFELEDANVAITTAYDGDRLGDAMCGLGDVDGDGRADFAVGGPAHSQPEEEIGVAWVFLAAPI